MTDRHECFMLEGVKAPFRILHISDVHFSVNTTHEKNQQTTAEIMRKADFYSPPSRRPALIAVTGDLISRTTGESAIPDAIELLIKLKQIAPVAYSLGNHEGDLEKTVREEMLTTIRRAGILVLDNTSVLLHEIVFTGLTLPQTVYKNKQGNYFHLDTITPEMIHSCVGPCISRPCVLLAHSPMGFEAYAAWGADIVLSGHVHGGIVRVPVIGGLLSPERKFFPRYTKGVYQTGNCYMNVSAGIGKLRVNNPAELICIDLLPTEVK